MSDLHPHVLTYLAATDAFNRNDLAAVAEYELVGQPPSPKPGRPLPTACGVGR